VAEEIQRWIDVYRDLVDAKRVMLRSAERRIAEASAEARREFRRTDATVLGAERRRLERRLAFWRRQSRALKAKHD
jgi:hypothetical protein